MIISLRKGNFNGEKVNFETCHFDIENATLGTDYTIVHRQTGAYPATGETLQQIRINIPLAGIDKLSNYDTDPHSARNLAKYPRVKRDSDANTTDVLGAYPVGEIGVQPTDWALHWRDKYYTRQLATYNGENVYQYFAIENGVWSADTQYYTIPDTQCMYYTDSGGFFGVSRFYTRNANSITFNDRGLYSAASYASSSWRTQFWWRSGGADGTLLFYQSYTYGNRVVIGGTTSTPVTWSAFDEITGRNLLQLVDFTIDGVQYIGLIFAQMSVDAIVQNAQITALSMPFWRGEISPKTWGNKSQVTLGNGTFDNTSDSVDFPALPTALNALNYENGMHINVLDANQLGAFLTALWGRDAFSIWQNYQYNPFSGVLACHQLPIVIPTDGTTYNTLSVSGTQLTVSNQHAAQRIIAHDVGSIDIPEYYGSAFDYAPYTNCKIHLPFCGEYPIDINDIMGGSISIRYHFDIATGDCVAFILGTNRDGLSTLRGVYNGNAAFTVPITSNDAGAAGQLSALSQMLGGAGQLIAGNYIGGAMSVAGGALSSMIAQQHTSFSRLTGNRAAISSLTCYLSINRVIQSYPDNYDRLMAHPADIGGTVSTTADGYAVSGYTVYSDVDLLGVPAAAGEIEEIRRLLTSGVYV